MDDRSEDRLTDPSRSLWVTAAVVALMGIVWGIFWLYQTHLAPTPAELRWTTLMSNPLPALTADTSISLYRSRCYGECPAYTVTISGSGRVDFKGVAFICEKTPQATHVGAQMVARLVHAMTTMNFMNEPDHTHMDMTDQPLATVTLTTAAGTHSIKHYLGDTHAPRLLIDMENEIDKVAGSATWTGTWRNGARQCPARPSA